MDTAEHARAESSVSLNQPSGWLSISPDGAQHKIWVGQFGSRTSGMVS